MRPSNKQRSRNKPGNNQQRRNQMGNIVNRVFDSAGPDGKVRGTPQQIIEKYQVLARDAQLQGDRVAGESFLQYAEHYARMLGEAQRQQQEMRQPERDEREERDEAPQREDDRQQREEAPRREDDRQQRRQEPREQQNEPSALATFGDSERDDSGPVETPEAAAQAREGDGGAPAHGDAPTAGSEPEAEPSEEPAAEAAPPKRTRSRRKKPAPQVAEAAGD